MTKDEIVWLASHLRCATCGVNAVPSLNNANEGHLGLICEARYKAIHSRDLERPKALHLDSWRQYGLRDFIQGFRLSSDGVEAPLTENVVRAVWVP